MLRRPPIPTLFPYTTLFRSFISKRRISGMALLILALLQRIFLMSSLMLLLVWLIFFMVLIKLLPILGMVNRAKKSGMVNITSSVNSRERSGINTILHELNPLFTINVTMRDIKSKNVYSRVNSKATTQWRKTESANGVHLEGVASDNRS